jgi:predicted nucleotidyltransferase
MRLNEEQVRIIRESTQSVFGAHARVRLFGSRLNEDLRGGDIDLMVECDEPVPDRLGKSLALVARLQMALGDQPIDVLVIDPNTELKPVHKAALSTGVAL